MAPEIDFWAVAGLVTKLFWYLGVLAAVGGTFSVWILSDASRKGLRWSLIYSLAGALIGFHAVIGYFLVQVGAANDSGLAGMLDWPLIRFYLGLDVGEASLFRMAIFLVLAALQAATLAYLWRRSSPPESGQFRLFYRLNGAALLFLLLSFQSTGHIAPLAFPVRTSLVLHVIAAFLWLGSLLPLARAVWMFDSVQLQSVMRLFSRRASVLVAVLLGTALIMLFQVLESPAALTTSVYGLSLLLKMSLVAALLSLAALNRWLLVPNLEQPGGRTHLRRSITLEMVFGLLVLATTVYLSTVIGPETH